MHIDDISGFTELTDVTKLFYDENCPDISLHSEGNVYAVTVGGVTYKFDYSAPEYDIIPEAHRDGRLSKVAVFDALQKLTGKNFPWGALTGVRPMKLFYECIRAGMSTEQAKTTVQRVYRISEFRADILKRTCEAQHGKLHFAPEYYNLYVHVPYCTSRCNYCSFVSVPIAKYAAQSHTYVDLLCDEIKKSVEFLRNNGKKVLSVYIGGGTPSALCDEDFERMLEAIGISGVEYTCEAGRPDTVTESKADIMRAYGITRVCVNPQTLSDKTLALIGRSHTVKEFYSAYDIISSRGFDINCDLIAGLDGESLDDFKISFDGIKKLSPQNFTVHSLSKKNGSNIRYRAGENAEVAAMTEYALNNLGEYRPYYLYRQKRQAGNLENVGFALPGTECVNNITTMEETVGVMACGAGAISKIVEDGKIIRVVNIHDVPMYIANYESRLRAKFESFSSALNKNG